MTPRQDELQQLFRQAKGHYLALARIMFRENLIPVDKLLTSYEDLAKDNYRPQGNLNN